MYLHITTGTVSYLKDLQVKYPDLMIKAFGQRAILYYEDDKEDTIFNSNRSYSIIDQKGELNEDYPSAIFTIPVAHSNRTSTLAHLTDLHQELQKQNGLLAHRIGEGTNTEAFVVFSTWASKEAYSDFKDTDTYKQYLSSDVLKKFRNEESLFQDYIAAQLYLPLQDNIEEEEEDY